MTPRQPREAFLDRPLRIGLMGTRGIPASYGGFETFYEHLAPRLAARGHHVAVYNRPHVTGHTDLAWYRGVRLHHIPSIRTKHLDTISHTTISVLHGALQRFDIVYVCGVGNTSLAWVPRLFGAAVVLNVDSADWKRAKWGGIASRYLRGVERLTAVAANVVVADNPVIRDRYLVQYGIEAVYSPYGASFTPDAGTEALDTFGLVPDRYVLWVGRLEPETRVEELIAAFRLALPNEMRLVIVGDAPFAGGYRDRLHGLGGPDVIFTGYQYGAAYRQLTTHAFAYVQTSPTSGTSPALLEQMAAGNAVIVRGTETNRAVIADAGLSYDPEDPVDGLADCLRLLQDAPRRAVLRSHAQARAEREYNWDRITDDYEVMFTRFARRRHGSKRVSTRR
jgi:glycosyltransferase involved in cell wall biosynthesis